MRSALICGLDVLSPGVQGSGSEAAEVEVSLLKNHKYERGSRQRRGVRLGNIIAFCVSFPQQFVCNSMCPMCSLPACKFWQSLPGFFTQVSAMFWIPARVQSLQCVLPRSVQSCWRLQIPWGSCGSAGLDPRGKWTYKR